MSGRDDLTDGRAWLAGYRAHERGEPCPWGDESARQGWITAREHATEGA